ncbi:hypothetical protein IAD21_03646 [Abditibacteriota bacterium]|nr:hypothetical protein IAD21_03646 [Abditibacteriota bacterium]
MKTFFCGLVLFCFLSSASASEVGNERLVQYCNAILLQDGGIGEYTDYPPHLVVRRFASKARHYFATRSFAQKRIELQRAAHLPLSNGAIQSVAYVSAMSGIKPYSNARRMLGYEDVAHPLYPQMPGLGENVYGNIWKIYKKFPDHRIALLLLEGHNSDGAGAEVVRSVRFGMLEKQPRFIFGLAMQSKRAFSKLNEDFEFEASEKEFRVLRRLCHDPDPILRQGARQIRHHVHAYHSRFKRHYFSGT